MADSKKIFVDKDKYSKLKIYRNRMFTLFFSLLVGFIILTSVIFGELLLGHHWLAMTVPISIIGTYLIFYPPTEEWEYKPWQSQSEKREQTFYN